MNTGVYKIQNNHTGRLYIGSSCNIRHRLQRHKYKLKNNNHENQALQNAWNFYDADSFSFQPILICSVENLIMYEQLIIDSYKANKKPFGYNIRKIAQNNTGLSLHPNTKAGIKKKWSDPVWAKKMQQKAIEQSKNPIFRKKFIEALLKCRLNPEIEKRRKDAASKANSLRCKGVPLKKEHIEKMVQTKQRKLASGEWIPKIKHGMTETPEYRAWCKMLSRCNNPNDAKYPNVGAKNIKVCLKWTDNFEQFYKDMGARPIGLFLGRKDITKDYNKDNCIWSTAKMLSHSSTQVKLVKLNNQYLPLSEAARTLGLHHTSIQQRARDYGISYQEATDYFFNKRKVK